MVVNCRSFFFGLIAIAAMLGTQLNDKVVNKELEVKTVVQLNKYICNVVQEVR